MGSKAKKIIGIFLVSLILLAAIGAGAVYFINASWKYDAEAAEQVKAEIMDDLVVYMIDFKKEHPEAVVELDFSDVRVSEERTILDSFGELEGTARFIISSPEINPVLEKNEYTYDDYEKIAYFDISLMDTSNKLYGYVSTDNYSLGDVDFSLESFYKDSNSNLYYTTTESIEEGIALIGTHYRIIKNNEIVFEHTETHAPVYPGGGGGGGGSSSGSSSSGNKKCSKCGSYVSHTTANGMCKTCVDIYVNDWYIGYDGDVYIDRPY